MHCDNKSMLYSLSVQTFVACVVITISFFVTTWCSWT